MCYKIATRFRYGILFAATLSMIFGCQSQSEKTITNTISFKESSNTLYFRIVSLSSRNRADSKTHIELLSIARDGKTSIKLESGVTLSGMPGDYFNCNQFGSNNLQLVSASAEPFIAVFRYLYCK
jgi:hypothetical protein